MIQAKKSSWFPVARFVLPCPDEVAEIRAIHRDGLALQRRMSRRGARFSALGTGSFPEVPPVWTGLTALANSASETSLLTGAKSQPALSRPMLDLIAGRGISFEGWGILGTTSTPTITFKFYLNPTQGISTLGGTTIGATAAITTITTVSNKQWSFKLDLALSVPGDGTNNATLFAQGYVRSPAGFAAPYEYTITPGTGDSATVSATLDGAQSQWFNMSGTWGTANASNTITLEQMRMTGWN